jgi:DNA-binding transcriptional MerR regulator
MKTTPAYNLSVVIRETGIKPDTLRAWERRYGLPKPARTEGGHRLYSDRDIASIHWLIERLDEGLRIKQAVHLWQDIESSGQDPLLLKPTGTQSAKYKPEIIEGTPELSEMRSRWITACLRFDETSAENILNYAFALYKTETVCFEVLLAGLAEIGDGWYRGDASVQQEHFASSLTTRRLDALIAASPTPYKHGPILVACPPREDHTIAPLMLTLLLRQRGWRIVYLGANVPLARFEETISTLNPLLIILTAQHLISAANLLDIAEAISQNNIRIAYGGFVYIRNPALRTITPGHYLGDQLKNAAQVVEDILTGSPPILNFLQKVVDFQIAEAYYRAMQSRIESVVTDQLNPNQIQKNHLSLANEFLSQDIQACLRLGNLDLLMQEISWIKELTINYQVSTETLKTYLSTYYQAAKSILDARGNLVVDALSRIIKSPIFEEPLKGSLI